MKSSDCSQVHWMKWLAAAVYAALILALVAVMCTEKGPTSPIIECAEDLIRSAEDDDEKARALYHLAEYYFNMGQTRQAYKYLEMIDDTLIRAEVQGMIVAEQVSRGRTDKEVLSMAKGIQSNYERSLAYRLLADGFIKDDDKEQALDLLNMSMNAAEQVEEDRDRALLFTYVAGNYAEMKEHDRALDLLSQALNTLYMSDDTTERFLEIGTLKIIASTYWKNGQTDVAEALLDSVFRLSLSLDDFFRNRSLFYLSQAYSEMGNTDMVIRVARLQDDPEQMDMILANHVPVMIKNEGYEPARKIIRTIKTQYSYNTALMALAKGYIHEERFEQALNIIDSVDDGTMKAHALLYISRKYMDLDRKEEGLALCSEALHAARTSAVDWQKSMVLTRIANYYGHENQYDTAFDILQEALEIIDRDKEAYWRDVILTDISEEFAKIKKYRDALHVVEKIRMPKHKTSALIGIEQQRRESGDQLDAPATRILEKIQEDISRDL